MRTLVFALVIGLLSGCSVATKEKQLSPPMPDIALGAPPSPLAFRTVNIQPVQPAMNTERYDRIRDNVFVTVKQEPLSTFSIDVDTASYSNVRRFLSMGDSPPKDAVRIEELINYFDYSYPQPNGTDPFAVQTEVATCPWEPRHYLARIGIKADTMKPKQVPPCNLVFLLDVSGSMGAENKLPLVKKAMAMLVDNLTPRDRIAIAVYAGASGLVLPSTPVGNKKAILDSLEQLEAGGSTNGGAGIQLAYATAEANFIEGGNNRVILATDGDFNVGVTSEGELTRLIEDKRASGVFLTVLGFGMGNYNDSSLEKLADLGNGNYAYIDSIREARKVFVHQLPSTLFTVAKDVKIQVEFNPSLVAGYRLIGYENRLMQAEEFNDDAKDAGEIGAGHTVTALYEIVPVGVSVPVGEVDPLKYQEASEIPGAKVSNELMTVKLRYKDPDGEESKLISVVVANEVKTIDAATPDLRFASGVAAFGLLLRDSPYKGTSTFDAAFELAKTGIDNDEHGYRTEFLTMIKQAKGISRKEPAQSE